MSIKKEFIKNMQERGITPEQYMQDMQFIKDFSNEIDEILLRDEQEGKIKYTRTGYYKLNDGSKASGYDGAKKADKHYIKNVFNKRKVEKLEYIINTYFRHLDKIRFEKDDIRPFKIEQTNSLLGKQKGDLMICKRWASNTYEDMRDEMMIDFISKSNII